MPGAIKHVAPIVDPGEDCDLGSNNADSSGCTSTCHDNICGDGHKWLGVEQCDDGDEDNTDNCTSLCSPPSCDDGITSGFETDLDCGGDACAPCDVGLTCDFYTDCVTAACVAGTCQYARHCAELKSLSGQLDDGVYPIDPDKNEPGMPFDVYCDMSVDGGGWTSLMHVTPLDRLNFSIEHAEAAVSESTNFWILDVKPDVAYSLKTWDGFEWSRLHADATTPAETGWLWNGVDYPNPPECHEAQDLYLLQSPNVHPRSAGNPHFNDGLMKPDEIGQHAYITASTIDVAPISNYGAVHIGCVGYNILEDPVVWIR